jgi:hypothetical protein
LRDTSKRPQGEHPDRRERWLLAHDVEPRLDGREQHGTENDAAIDLRWHDLRQKACRLLADRVDIRSLAHARARIFNNAALPET